MKKIFILLFALCSALLIYAQPNEYIIDRGMDETAHAIDLSSMGYMVAGSTNSIGSGGTDIFLYGLTSNFDTIWSNTMGGPGDDMAWDVCMMNTLMAKMMVSLVGGSWDNGSDKDMYVVELDEYGFSYTDVLFDFGNGDDEILALSASDPYLPCFTGYKTTSLGDKDIVLGWLEDNYYSLDTSSSFSTFSYGGTGDEAGYGVHESGLATIVTGYTTSYGAGGMDALIVNYDRNQTMLSWDKYYGGAGDDVAKKAFFDDTYGQYLVVGYTESFGAGNRDIWLLSLDIAGDTNWTKTYGDIYDDEPYYMEWDNDVLYVAGYTTDPVNMDKNFYFLMIDPLNGDVIDEKISGSPAVDEIAFDLFRDGCYYNLVGDASGDYYMGQKDRISLNPVIKDVDCHGLGEIEIFPSGEGYIMMIEWSTLGAGIFAYDTTFVDNLATGEYNLYLYDDIYGCTIQDTFIIAEIPLMALDSVITDASCGGQCDGTAEVIVTGGQAPFTYLWDPSAGSQTNSLAVDLCMGFYNVTVTDNVNCQQNLFAFVGELPLGYISGTVNNTSYGSIPDDSATVYLLKFENSYIVDTMDAVNIYSSQYEFFDVYPGEYLIKVEVNPGLGFDNVLDTYHDSAFTWINAWLQPMSCGDTVSFVTSMYEMTPMGSGNGNISGYIHYFGGTKAFGEPVPGAEVYIEQEPNDEPIASTETDTAGWYGFGGVEQGNDYMLFVDIPGLPLISTHANINVTANDTLFENLNFIVDTTSGGAGIYVDATGMDETVFRAYFNTYPNPFCDNLNIDYRIEAPASVELQILDLNGRLVETLVNAQQEAGEFTYTFHALQNGVYIIHLRINDTNIIRKVISQK